MSTDAVGTPAGLRRSRPRRYLMCPPTFFAVRYAINPWMDPSVPVDRPLALRQWQALVDLYRGFGHRVDLLAPVDGLPDMVFAANGATVVDGRVLGARFAHPQRRAEADQHGAFHRAARAGVTAPRAVNEGEGDFAVLSDRVLAGHGFRTELAAHRELAALTGRQVISLELVDPRFYHLDTALAVLDDVHDHVAYYPGAFSAFSRRQLAALFPDAVLATEADATAFGLNSVSDGRRVVMPPGADHLAAAVAAAGYAVTEIDLSELLKGGGSVKCCTSEIRSAPPTPEEDPR